MPAGSHATEEDTATGLVGEHGSNGPYPCRHQLHQHLANTFIQSDVQEAQVSGPYITRVYPLSHAMFMMRGYFEYTWKEKDPAIF